MATYWVKSGAGGTDAGTSWANAAESIPGLMVAQAIAGGDIIYVHNTHAYNAGATITWTLPESGTGLVQVICVDGGDATGASLVDGTVGNITTGAVEETGGNFSFTVETAASNSLLYVHGITFKTAAGASSSAADIHIKNSSNGRISFNACSFWVNSTNTQATINTGSNTSSVIVFNNCTFRSENSQGFANSGGVCRYFNCVWSSSGTAPTTVFAALAGSRTNTIECVACDWARGTNVVTVASTGNTIFKASGCAIGTPTTGTHLGRLGGEYEFIACAPADGTNGADMLSYYLETAYGVVEDDQTVYLTTGSATGEQDDGTNTQYSLKMNASTIAGITEPLYTPWFAQFVGSTGSKTISVKCADTEAAVLKDTELWLEVAYHGGSQLANSPQMQIEETSPLQTSTIYRDVTAAGSNLSDTGEAWTGITETGTYTLSKSVTLDEQGYVLCRVALAKDTTNPVYVDPKITVA